MKNRLIKGALEVLICMAGITGYSDGREPITPEVAQELYLLGFRTRAVENFIEGARLLDPRVEFGLFVNEWDPQGVTGMVFFSGARLHTFGLPGNRVFCFYNPLLETAWLTTWTYPDDEGIPRVQDQEWRVRDRETEAGIPPWWNGQAPLINGLQAAGRFTAEVLRDEFRLAGAVEVRERVMTQLNSVSRLRRKQADWWSPPAAPTPIVGHEGERFDPTGPHAYWMEGARPVFASPAGPFRWVAYMNPHHPRFVLLAMPEEPDGALRHVFPMEFGR